MFMIIISIIIIIAFNLPATFSNCVYRCKGIKILAIFKREMKDSLF